MEVETQIKFCRQSTIIIIIMVGCLQNLIIIIKFHNYVNFMHEASN